MLDGSSTKIKSSVSVSNHINKLYGIFEIMAPKTNFGYQFLYFYKYKYVPNLLMHLMHNFRHRSKKEERIVFFSKLVFHISLKSLTTIISIIIGAT